MDCTFIKNKLPNACCGCEACSFVCPRQIIKMKEDSEGFVYPMVTEVSLCIKCGMCEKVCPVTNPENVDDSIKSFCSGHLNSDDDIRASASGGLATAISRSFIVHYGGVVYGVSYSDDFKSIRYEKASTLDGLEKFRGSKYVQARKSQEISMIFDGGAIYKSILSDLKLKTPVLFIGLPCEVAALNNITKHKFDNLYTIELVCHGPTSQKVHREYVGKLEKERNSALSYFSVRHKNKGWKPYYVKASFDNKSIEDHVATFHETEYGIAFRYLKRPSCATCKFKLGNVDAGLQADITIGDFHYAGPSFKAWNKWGSSVGYVHTEKGNELIRNAESLFNFYETNPVHALKSSEALAHIIKPRLNRKIFSKSFEKSGLTKACSHYTVKIIDFYSKSKKNIITNLVKIRNFLRKCLR